MDDKKTNWKEQNDSMTIVLSAAALVLLAISVFARHTEIRSLATWLGFGFVLAAVLFKLFGARLGHKPSRGELEDRVFEREKSEKK